MSQNVTFACSTSLPNQKILSTVFLFNRTQKAKSCLLALRESFPFKSWVNRNWVNFSQKFSSQNQTCFLKIPVFGLPKPDFSVTWQNLNVSNYFCFPSILSLSRGIFKINLVTSWSNSHYRIYEFYVFSFSRFSSMIMVTDHDKTGFDDD